MRIVHVIDYFQPELGYQETHLAHAQQLAGHEVKVVTSDRTFPFPEMGMSAKVSGPRIRTLGITQECGIEVHRLAVRFELQTRVWLRGLAKKISELRPDLIIGHGMGNFTSLRLASSARNTGARLVIDEHMQDIQLRRGAAAVLWRKGQRALVQNALAPAVSRFVGVTPSSVKILQEVYGVPAAMCQLIPLGTWAVSASETSKKSVLRSSLQLPSSSLVVGYVGRLARQKEIERIIESVASLRRESLDVIALLVGDGDHEYRRELLELSETLGVREAVYFRGAVPSNEVPSVLGALDVAVWPRGVSATMIDALAAGAALVIPSYHGTDFYVEGGGGATFSSPSEMLSHLKAYALDRELLSKDQDFARNRSRLFDWNVLAECFISGEEPVATSSGA